MTSRWKTALAAVALSMTTLSGCAMTSVAPVPLPSHTQPAIPDGLADFYNQEIVWSGCGGGECATIRVPMDYDNPSAGLTTISAWRQKSDGQTKPLGTLVVNPGGPGASGIGYARDVTRVASPTLKANYDIVGFDPRGVGASNPLWCLDTAEMDKHMSSDVTPDDDAEAKQALASSHEMAAACVKAAPELIKHMSSLDTARDLDIIRAVLGDRHLNFLASSYGSMIASAYIDEFGPNVGRFVLNGPVDPALSGDEITLGQAKGFDTVVRRYLDTCTAKKDCPLGNDPEAADDELKKILSDLDASPLKTSNQPGVLNGSWGLYGVIQGMYADAFWPKLDEALRDVKSGKGDTLMELARSYTGRGNDSYTSNIFQVMNAVGCADRGSQVEGLDHIKDLVTQAKKEAPLFGEFLAWSRAGCDSWPVKQTWPSKVVKGADVTSPILVLATTGDPATPYAWGKKVSEDLDTGFLVTREGNGHTAYLLGNSCIDEATDTFLLTGRTPEKTTC